jgi:mitosis inhibitor protein kinase SWE1
LLTEDQVWDILLDMACSLKQVHDSGFVHMDIKPGNFFVKADGTVKLGDFG